MVQVKAGKSFGTSNIITKPTWKCKNNYAVFSKIFLSSHLRGNFEWTTAANFQFLFRTVQQFKGAKHSRRNLFQYF